VKIKIAQATLKFDKKEIFDFGLTERYNTNYWAKIHQVEKPKWSNQVVFVQHITKFLFTPLQQKVKIKKAEML